MGNIIEMTGITKRFGGVTALSDVNLQIKEGEIHALIGENGAGKSTLMKILAGAYQKDEGSIIIGGEEMVNTSPKMMIEKGVSVIYQEFMLAPDLTVAENIFIDRLNSGKFFINWRELKSKAKEELLKLGFNNINPNEETGNLSVAYQQIVEICKCLARKSKVLVFDEPTAVLTHHETEKLLSIIKQLKNEGVTIVYISHRLEELLEISDRITILKDGKYVDTVETKNINKEELVTLMVGREIEQLFPQRNVEIGKEVLSVKNLSTSNLLKNIDFSLKQGEVLGFGGLIGSGRTELMRAIFGLDKIETGQIVYFGQNLNFKNPKEAIKQGIGFLQEDRKKQGVLLNQSIKVNTTLATLPNFTKLGFINNKKESASVEVILKKLSTKYGHIDDDVESLSGGNQQKVSIAKWLAANCKLIILDEPTRGVDIGAKTEIYTIINELIIAGVGVIVISSEMLEIVGICDRAIIMREGRIVGELAKEDITENNMIKLAMGV